MIISYHIISFQLVLVGEGDRGEKREREKKGRERERAVALATNQNGLKMIHAATFVAVALATEWA